MKTLEKEKPIMSASNQSAAPSPRRSLSCGSGSGSSSSSNTTFSTMKQQPTWLLSSLADMEERMKMLACSGGTGTGTGTAAHQQEQDIGDTFAQRAEAYYKRRPQLLSLLQDLYNAYLTLSDRYFQTIAKTRRHRRGHSSQISVIDNEYYDYQDQQDGDGDGDGDGDIETSQIDSDMESSLSYDQQLPHPTLMLAAAAKDNGMLLDLDAIVTEIVMKNVEYDILLDEANTIERRYIDSSRKIELQKSLLEVLESERLILLNENAKLGYRVGALVEENKAIASESLFIRRKAGELARCLLKVREDQRVCLLSRKIEDLQGQIYGLEKRNKEYYEQLVKRDNQRSFQLGQELERSDSINSKSKTKGGNQVNLEVCFQLGKINRRLKKGGNGKKGSSWWARVKNMDLFLCGHNHPSST